MSLRQNLGSDDVRNGSDHGGERNAPSTSAPVADGDAVLRSMADRVRDRIGRPVDRWAVVAALEAMGLRDEDARRHVGMPDLFALGDRLYPTLQAASAAERSRSTRTSRGWTRLGQTLWAFARGGLFVAPMALQIASVLFLGYSLWAWLHFTEAQATGVALGTLLSFVVTGGFVQSIGREGHLYLARDNPRLAYTACRRLMGLGMFTVGAVALFVVVLNVLFPHYPLSLIGVSALYFVLLSALWLSLSLLYVLDHLSVIVAITLVGLLPVFAVMTYTNWGIYAAHGCGIGLSVALAYGYGTSVLRRRIRRASTPAVNDVLPSLSIQIHSLRTYFGYGLCFFTFLSIDRIIAWSAAHPEPPPYIIWFRTPYELGVDWALLSLLFTLAVLQHTVQQLSAWLFPNDRSLEFSIEEATRTIQRFHLRHLGLVVIVGMISIVGTHSVIRALDQSALLQNEVPLLGTPITTTVFWGAAFGYLFLAVGLHNLLFSLILSKPNVSLRAFLYALGVNAIVGMALSRSIHYEYAVFGLLAGSLVLAVFSFVRTRQFLKAFAYHYYAAY